MRIVFLVLALGLAAVEAAPKSPQRIVGGSLTTIDQYPSTAALLISWQGVSFTHSCGGSILNNRAILTAAHCCTRTSAWQWHIRLGSTYANSGGIVHQTNAIILHPDYTDQSYDNDIAILHSATAFTFNDQVQFGRIAGPNYNVPDNTPVWAVGWGATSWLGPPSEQLRHVEVLTVNQEICRNRYSQISEVITDNMLCSGWLDVGGRDQCSQDSGGPLYHNGVIIGVCSWGVECAHPVYPGVNARVSRYTSWIQDNS